MADEILMKEIQEAIRKQLPGHISEELQRVLKEASGLKEEVDKLRIGEKNKNERITELSNNLGKHQEITTREAQLKEREAAVSKREMDMRVLEVSMQNANEKVAFAKDIVKLVFQNNHFKYSRRESESGYANGNSQNKNTTVDVSSEEEP